MGVFTTTSVRGDENGTLSQWVSNHCLHCHDSFTTEGELDLSKMIAGELSEQRRGRQLQRMLDRLQAGEMPPPDDNALTKTQRNRFATALRLEIDRLAEALRDDPGIVPIARLTPYEFRNSIRDLSGGVVTDAGRFLPNEGGAGEGFANVSAAQAMTPAQYEKYVDAAKDALRHLRVYPLSRATHRPAPAFAGQAADEYPAFRRPDLAWNRFPRPPVDTSAAARKEITDELIGWHVAQQQKWGQEHREHLEQSLGFVHAAYLEAAYRYRHRDDQQDTIEKYAWTYGPFPTGIETQTTAHRDEIASATERIRLAPAALAKWWAILNGDDADSPHAHWAKGWRELAKQSGLDPVQLRQRCLAITTGADNVIVETEDYAPDYEISFHEAEQEVLDAAENEGRWPFRIDIGDARELFLVVTDAGDGGRGEYAIWRQGRFVFRDGSAKPWHQVVTLVGANSGREYQWGVDGEGKNRLPNDSIGVRPPGALKFRVPDDAIVFEVDLTLDRQRTESASIQALVLKRKPKSQSYVPNRYVFGGKKRPVSAAAKLKKEQQRALRKRNIAEANRTKIGLNAERNVFANWNRSSLEAIGGPWPNQAVDQFEPQFPYHYTVAETLRNATDNDLFVLSVLQDRLVSLVDGCEEKQLRDAAKEVVAEFATAAWHRSLTNEDVEPLLALYDESRRLGFSFDSSVKSSLLAVLASPHFLYRSLSPVESSQKSVRPLTGHALAARLSFFLWASVPDAELVQLAESGRLREPAVLIEQAKRMLKDPRARSLAIDFAGQMWGFNDFESFSNPDTKRFPEFTPQLRKSMQDEVVAFLNDTFQNDRPLIRLIDAEYTFADSSLIRHYGLDQSAAAMVGRDTEDADIRRVDLPDDRGGLPTMALFLTKTSLPLRTSPVQRGVWILESVLGRHLPNPPADVPSLSEDPTNAEGESIREQLARHRADAACASCHDKIDPLGISLEVFDALGRVRMVDRDATVPQAIVTTADGVPLDGAVALRRYLLDHRQEFFQHFSRKLLGYALGRSVHIGDRALLGEMVTALSRDDAGMAELVQRIVSSPQFRNTRVSDE
jgi:hypothetical protein